MTVKFYTFSKRPNSTKQPAPNSEALSLTSVELKEECNFINPVLKLKGLTNGTTFVPGMYNYAYIPLWLRYYFIRDWRYINGLWEVELVIDPMASFKTDIGSTSTYIERCASASDGTIIDTLYPAKTNVAITKVNVATSWYNVAPSGGSYIVGLINYATGNKVGAVSYYALTGAQFAQLMAFLFSNNIFNSSSITEMGEGLYKSLFNPFQYVVSCLWFPFTTASFGSSSEDMKVGYWSTGINGLIVSSLAQKTYATATIPSHPQVSRGTYLNHAPYTRMCLYIPPFGSIPIDTNFVEIGNYLYSAVLVDHITGQATIRVAISQDSSHLDEYNIMTERSGMMGVPIQLAQVMSDYVNTVGSVSNAVGSLLSGNIGGLINSAMSAVESQMPKVSTSGANGSFIETLQYPVLMVEHLKLADEDNAEYGRPLCAVRTINTLSGYVKTGYVDKAFGCTEYERNTINQYMKTGFFYE